MSEAKFIHLHTHSHYSLLSALPKVDELVKQAKKYGMQTIVVGGGVAANTHLRTELVNHVQKKNPSCTVMFPTRELSTDNSLMIGLAGYYKISRDPEKKYETITADGNWELS